MMDWRLTAAVRRSGEEIEYRDADKEGIRVEFTHDIGYGCDICTRYMVEIENESGNDFQGIIHIKIVTGSGEPKFFMPGYMYNRNTADMPSSGRKAFPRIKRNPSGKPESEFFMTRSDRLSVPISMIWDEGKVIGISASPYWTETNGKSTPVSFACGRKDETDKEFKQYAGFSCNINDNGNVSIGYTLGYENAPWLFVQTARVIDRKPVESENAFVMKAGETLSFPLYVYSYEGDDERAIYRAIEHCYSIFHEAPRQVDRMNEDIAIEMLCGAIRDNAWLDEEKMYSGFVYDRENPRFNKIGSLSWTNGMAVAGPMLLAANHMNDEKAREQGIAFIENVVKNSYNPLSGFMFDAVEGGRWSVRGWWFNGMHSGGHSSYINGQAAYYILLAYESEKKRGVIHEQWLDFLQPIIRKMNEVLNTDDDRYDYLVKYPEYLSFTGNMSVGSPTTEENYFTDALIIWPKVSGGYDFGVILYENDMEYSIYIDSKGNALSKEDEDIVSQHSDSILNLLMIADKRWDIYN